MEHRTVAAVQNAGPATKFAAETYCIATNTFGAGASSSRAYHLTLVVPEPRHSL
jgi:hypothetical protein